MKWFLALLFVATVFGDLYDDPNYDPLEDCSVTTSKEFCEDFLRRRYGNSRAPPTSATTRSYKEAQLINAKEQKPEPEVNHESCAYLPFPLTDELTCPKGWTLFPETNYCYFAFSANYPYPDAVDVCEKHQATLTVPHSEEENYSIAQLARESIWIGLEFVQDFFHVKTTDGCAVEYTQFNHQRINADCFEAYMTKEGVWNHTGCDDYARLTHSAVCKKVPLVVRREPICPQPPTCKDGSCRLKCRHGWTRFENHCYKALNKQIYHSDQAVEHCIKEGGRLASVQSQEENDFINQLAQNAPKSKGKRALIGGDYNYDYKRFYWIDKCRFEYKNWAPNQPDRHGRKDCLEMELGSGHWFDRRCTAYGDGPMNINGTIKGHLPSFVDPNRLGHSPQYHATCKSREESWWTKSCAMADGSSSKYLHLSPMCPRRRHGSHFPT